MSTRYVWGKYEKQHELTIGRAIGAISQETFPSSKAPILAENYKISSDGHYVPAGSYFRISAGGTFSTSQYKYLFQYPVDSNVFAYRSMYVPPPGAEVWNVSMVGTTATIGCSEDGFLRVYTTEISYIKGKFIENVSSDYKTTYPSDGISGESWFQYIGSDSIDPTALKYSNAKPEAGETVVVSITPKSNSLGGTIYYQYSRSVNGGTSWANISLKTTETSMGIPVPSGATQFRARVLASDDIGFTSSTYVTGENLILNQAPSNPFSVTIPNVIYPEESFVVTWGAATDPDGNLSGYEIQRAYNGGSWSSVSTASGTSVTTSVSRGYKTVQYRVRAYDSNGEYSDWAYSNTASIRNLRAYVGISGKARKVDKLYVGVNGKARQVVKGYIGVNGKARKFL